MLSTTGTDKFDGSVPEITMCPPPALDAESSEPEADKRHPSLTKLSTESMYSGVPLANLVHDMPHMKREQVSQPGKKLKTFFSHLNTTIIIHCNSF